MTELNNAKGFCNEILADKIASIRKRSFRSKRDFTVDQFKKPVAFFTKKDRLMNGIGKELTIILRTKGCSWALGEMGGCSMCGYVQDAVRTEINPEYIIDQFDLALQNKI